MVKIVKRTEVTEDFKTAMISSYMQWLKLVNNGDSYDRSAKSQSIARLLPIVKKESPEQRSGYDYEVTRLRSTEYTEFFMGKHEDKWFMCGTTPHITIKDYRGSHKTVGELGRYNVYIPVSIFADPALKRIHMIPLRNPNASNRHPHHYVMGTGHPLDRPTGNCYGSYAGVLTGLLDNPDLPELFRQIMQHLRTYGDRPPRKIGQLDFDTTSKQ